MSSQASRDVPVFGPVPSRRLGRSLGINNIPFKHCSYSCIYCQLGRTATRETVRKAYYRPEEMLRAVQSKLERLASTGETTDFLTFVADGEPTLDANLLREVELLKTTGTKVAVITNASLITREPVTEALLRADRVSVKVDAVDEPVWRSVNRPAAGLELGSILDGIHKFSRVYEGVLTTETMLVRGIDDDVEHLGSIADFLATVQPARAFISVPTRPPAEGRVRPPGGEGLLRALAIFRGRGIDTRALGNEDTRPFTSTGDPAEDLLAITAVHPMNEQQVGRFLAGAGASRAMVNDLVDQGRLQRLDYGGATYYRKTAE